MAIAIIPTTDLDAHIKHCDLITRDGEPVLMYNKYDALVFHTCKTDVVEHIGLLHEICKAVKMPYAKVLTAFEDHFRTVTNTEKP